MKKIALLVASLLSAGSALAANTLVNDSFETNNVSLGGYRYAGSVVADAWSFSGGAGVSANGSAWNGSASDGAYFAFLQNESVLSQTFTSAALSNYSLSLGYAARTGYPLGQVVRVLLDDKLLGTMEATTTAWQVGSFSALGVAAGSHTLTFRGVASESDQSLFIDKVILSAAAVPEPESYAMLIAGLGVVGAIARRRKKA